MNKKFFSQQISTKWVVSPRLIFISLPFLIFPPALQEAKPTQFLLFWQWSLAAALSLIPAGFIYFLGNWLYFRKYKEGTVSLLSVLIFAFFVGGIKGFGTGFFALTLDILGPQPWDQISFRTLSAMAVALVFMPSICVLAETYSIFWFNRKKLIEEYLSVEYARLFNENAISILKSKLSKRVDDHIVLIMKETRSQLVRPSNLEAEWEKIARVLRETAESAIRPLSHELWKDKIDSIYLGFLDYLRFSIKIIKFNPLLVIGGYLVAILPSLQGQSSSITILLNLILRALLLFILLSTAEIIKEILSKHGDRYFFPILFVVAFLHFIGVGFINHGLGISNSVFNLAGTLWLVILILGAGTMSALIRTQQYELKKISELTTQARIIEVASRNELNRFSRDIAKYLHGTVQSRLMASAMSIENAGKSGDKKVLDMQIQKALETLEMPSLAHLSKELETQNYNFKDVVSRWDGVLDIKFSVSRDNKNLSKRTQKNISDVLDEALANAFRHGEATSVSIALYTNTNNRPELEIVDNGCGLRDDSRGLGMQLFSSISKNWNLSNSTKKNGAVLVLEIS